MNNYRQFLKFLDVAIQATNDHACNLSKIDEKQLYYQHERQLKEARRVLLKEYYAYETWAETGDYEVPEIKPISITFPTKTL